MAYFTYRARDRNGALVTGRIEGASTEEIEASLDRMGLIPIRVRHERGLQRLKLPAPGSLFKRVTDEDLILFSRQLATLFSAGIPLTGALHTLEEQMENPEFVKVIRDVREAVEEGSSLASALARHPKVFSELYTNMVEAGETAGILDSVLDRLAFMLEKNAENRSKVKSATLYPKIVLTAIVVAVIILMNFVIPKFARLYSSFDVPLPLPTRMLIAVSNAFASYWYIAAALIAAAYLLFRLHASTERGRYNLDRLLLRVPVFGPLMLKSILSRFARVLGSLYRSGLPILQSLDIVSRAVENRAVASAVKTVEEEVRLGRDLSEPMSRSPFFPPIVVQMVAVGEQTGNLDEMLEKVAQYYDREVDATIRNLTTILEPVLLLFIFAAVLFLALSIFLPMWDLLKIVRR